MRKKNVKKVIKIERKKPRTQKKKTTTTIRAKGKKKVGVKRAHVAPLLTKFSENPIITAKKENQWESWQTFNPGAIALNDTVHFLYRAIGEDGISRLGYAASHDGLTIDERMPRPVYEHRMQQHSFNPFSYASGGSFGGAEDPRIVRVGAEDTIYMTYTACDGGLGVALTSIQKKDFLNKKWKWKKPALISKPGETHKNWVIFPEKIRGRYAILHAINPAISIAYRDNLDFSDGSYVESRLGSACQKNCWDTCIRGAGAPPIKTTAGWLLFYHAIDERDPGKYKVGAMLLDLEEPERILYRAAEPILEPEETYEMSGFKPGVVYVSGAVVKNEKLLVYYGAADSHIGVACARLSKFVEALTKKTKPKLTLQTIRQNIHAS